MDMGNPRLNVMLEHLVLIQHSAGNKQVPCGMTGCKSVMLES
jgi:hypothetical protein